MAQLLAPYNNSMRLGQGFNSYTQQTCLDKAVLPDTTENRKQLKERIVISGGSKSLVGEGVGPVKKGVDSEDSEDPSASYENQSQRNKVRTIEVHPWVKPQIVTYSSKFVDKLSDVTEAMNISGSLSIKTATIGGKANGSYVDSDKFKSSDINFHLQVKVTNQIHDADNYNIFNVVPNIDATSFPEVYGDSFISGWEEGGELNAIISMKVTDKSKIFSVKAGLEAQLSTASIGGEVKAQAEIDKNEQSSDTETTITVNWSGGGSIKDPGDDWTISSLKAAAAAFPELVAVTPQRTYAILTKYTALASFHEQNIKVTPLDYENAGIYTGSLLDAYMDYKSLWKQISQATHELESGRATIEIARPTEEIYELARVKAIPANEIMGNKQLESSSKSGSSDSNAKNNKGNAGDANLKSSVQLVPATGAKLPNEVTQFTVFSPSFAGLILARKICRFEMSKIVNEVDLVAKHPKMASDTTRDQYFLPPLVFKQLLPVVRSLTAENAKLGIKDPNAALLLGYVPPNREDFRLPPVFVLSESQDLRKCGTTKLQDSIDRVKYRAEDYRMQGVVGEFEKINSNAEVFNDLERLNSTWRPKKFSVWNQGDQILGGRIDYANGEKNEYGECKGSPAKTLELEPDGSEVIVEVTIRSGPKSSNSTDHKIVGLTVMTSKYNVIHAGDKYAGEVKDIKTFRWSAHDDSQWTLRGFFGFKFDGAIITMGVIWGKDGFVPVPTGNITMPLCKDFLGLSKEMQEKIKSLSNRRANFIRKFLMGNPITTSPVPKNKTIFNALDDIDLHWKIQTIAFSSKEGKLIGIKVIYQNQEELTHGRYTPQNETWRCDIKSPLVICKLATGKSKDDKSTYIETLEFIMSDQNGKVPEWLLNLSTLRYLGDGEASKATGQAAKPDSQVVESAPTFGSGVWSVRGFYGEHDETQFTQLGMIWGRG
ncbi:hypothetical protein TWF694_005568 [Orbilia ellipsospora]|uniref:Jacalin-type lectin domain-containing protein n=1 Tax=Orbilia ellipsospora TaxID=2528407 RepID=A0AAV9WTJ2_9PEZI